MALTYNIYQNGVFKQSVDAPLLTLTDLEPGNSYSFQVTEVVDGVESAKSNEMVVFTHGTIVVPSHNVAISLKGCVDPIGLEAEGFDTGVSFGGTEPVLITMFNTEVLDEATRLIVPGEWHMGDTPAALVGEKTYLATKGNRSAEIITV